MTNCRDHKTISKILKEVKQSGKKIIATNGCFDILHVGHLRYLEASKKFGDILVVGLNSDTSVKILKGQDRPINHEDDRAEMLLGLKSVDYVVIFDELDACNFLEIVKPDIYTKGGDYTAQDLSKWTEYKTAQDLNCKIEIITLVEGKSSTNIIKQINKSCKA